MHAGCGRKCATWRDASPSRAISASFRISTNRFGGLRFDLARRDEFMIAMIRAARQSITKQLIIDDTAAMIAFLDGRDKVKEGPMGAVGYCM